IAEDSGAITITQAQLLANAADLDLDTLTVSNVSASSGRLVANGNGIWTFTPAHDFNGPVNFTYDVTDGDAVVAGRASMAVTPVNDAPTTGTVTLPTVTEDSGPVTLTQAQLLAKAGDVDGDALSITQLSASSGTLVATGNGTWAYTAARDF